MALNWTIPEKTLDTAKQVIDSTLSKMPIPSFAQVSWDKDELCVKIDKAGKSEFRMAIKPEGSGVKVVETKRDIAFMHKPFVSKVEGFVQEVMDMVGARKA